MLSDTMKKVNEAERAAQEIVQNAKKNAADIVASAKEQAQKEQEAAVGAAKDEAKDRIDRATAKWEGEKQTYASEVQKSLTDAKAAAMGKADIAVDAIIAGLV